MRRAASILAALAIAACLASCDGLRLNLFAYNSTGDRPNLIFWPQPNNTVYSSPQRINIGLPARFNSWSIRYTTDPGLSAADAESWTAYDPNIGLYLTSTATLRAIAYLPNTVELSAVASGHYDFNIPNVLIYVDSTGSDSASGTVPTAPLRTIQAGIDLAASMYASGGNLAVVCVRMGTYNESPTMKPGVLLRGSYNWDWSPQADVSDPSAVSPTSFINGVGGNEVIGTGYGDWTPQYALRFPAGMAYPSEVQHFTINSAFGGTRSAAVLVESTQTRLFDCRIIGGSASGTAAGAWNKHGGAVLESCYVRGRSIDSYLTGNSIGVVNLGAVLDTRRTAIDSGVGVYGATTMDSIGIYSMNFGAIRSSIAITDACSITAIGGNGTANSFGVYAIDGAVDISGGTSILGGMTEAQSAGVSIGLFLEQTQTASVQGNTISGGGAFTSDSSIYSGRSYGILILNAASAGSVNVSSNRIKGGPAADITYGLRVDGSLGSLRVSENSLAGEYTQNSSGTPGYAAGILIGSGVSNASPIVIERNRIFGGSMPFSNGYEIGLYIAQNDFTAPCIVRNNVIHGGGSGPYVIHSYGALVAGSLSSSSEHVYFLGDTIFSGGNPTGTEYGIYFDSTGILNVDIFGCIIDSNNLAIYSPVSAARPSKFFNNCLRSSQYIVSLNPICKIGGVSIFYSGINSVGVSGTGNLDYYLETGAAPLTPIPYSGGSTNPVSESAFLAFDYGIDVGSSLGLALANNGPTTIPVSGSIDDGMDFFGNARHTSAPRTIGAVEHY